MLPIILYPSLGSVHIVQNPSFTFLAHCQVENISEIELFTNIEQQHFWKAIPFTMAQEHKWHLRIDIPNNTCFFSFTIRYRFENTYNWNWLGNNDNNGTIVVRRDTPHPVSLSSILDSEEQEFAQIISPDVNTWTISVSIPTSNHETIHRLGIPRFMLRYLAISQENAYWLCPFSGSTNLAFTYPVVYLLYVRSDGRYVLVLPLSGTLYDCNSHLTVDHGVLFLSTKNDSDSPGKAYYVVSTSFSFDSLSRSSFDCIRRLFGEQAQPTTLSRLWASDLFYCTWNAFGTDLSSERILAALQDLHDSGIRVRGLIIDDGWQSINEKRQMTAFEARFSGGLKALITQIRARFRYINDIGVWHSIIGYWQGLCPSSFPDFSTVDIDVGSSTISIIGPTDIQRFYDEYYTFLKNQGVNCVKVDVQGIFETVNLDRTFERRIWRHYQNALNAVATKHFDRKVIWCMSMNPKILYTSLLRTDLPLATFRNSNDYRPLVPLSHPIHVYHNIYNSLFTGQLSSKPDWDMFMSKHEFGAYHGVSRCLSGSSVMITDPLQEHDLDVLNAMTIGKGRILRASGNCAPVDLFMNINQGGTLKMRNQVFEGVFALGLFNVNDKPAGCIVCHEDFGPEVHIDIYYSYFAKDIGRVDDAFPKTVLLEKASCELLTGYNLRFNEGISVACLGLVDKYVSFAAVKEWKFSNRKITVKLHGVGILGIYIEGFEISSESLHICVDGLKASEEAISMKDQLLLVDLAKAKVLRAVSVYVSVSLKCRERGDLGEWVVL